jgi:hypothetical protein
LKHGIYLSHPWSTHFDEALYRTSSTLASFTDTYIIMPKSEKDSVVDKRVVKDCGLASIKNKA